MMQRRQVFEISIHAPRTGSDTCERRYPIDHDTFQSTLPARGATAETADNNAAIAISIHAPRTGSDVENSTVLYVVAISIHAPRTGSDVEVLFMEISKWISIHAPRTGSDFQNPVSLDSTNDFNPRSPHGERPNGVLIATGLYKFQSTLPARGAT